VSEAAGQHVVLDALEDRHHVVVAEAGNPDQRERVAQPDRLRRTAAVPVPRPAPGVDRLSDGGLAPVALEPLDGIALPPLADDVGAEELPADVAEHRQPGDDEAHADPERDPPTSARSHVPIVAYVRSALQPTT